MGRLIVLATLLLAMATTATTAMAQARHAWKPAATAAAKPRRTLLPGNPCVEACEASYQDAVASCNAAFDPSTNCAPDDAACIADYTALRASCINDATTTRDECRALCPPPTCSELCEQTHQDALASCAQFFNPDACGGDPDCIASMEALYAACVASADAAHVACLAACGPTPNRRHTWAQVKAIYR